MYRGLGGRANTAAPAAGNAGAREPKGDGASRVLGGHPKTGHWGTAENRPVVAASRTLTNATGPWARAEVNVLSDDKKQQVLALGRLGWTLRDIEEAVGVRRETASGYLKAAGIAVGRREHGGGRRQSPVTRRLGRPSKVIQSRPVRRG